MLPQWGLNSIFLDCCQHFSAVCVDILHVQLSNTISEYFRVFPIYLFPASFYLLTCPSYSPAFFITQFSEHCGFYWGCQQHLTNTDIMILPALNSQNTIHHSYSRVCFYCLPGFSWVYTGQLRCLSSVIRQFHWIKLHKKFDLLVLWKFGQALFCDLFLFCFTSSLIYCTAFNLCE